MLKKKGKPNLEILSWHHRFLLLPKACPRKAIVGWSNLKDVSSRLKSCPQLKEYLMNWDNLVEKSGVRTFVCDHWQPRRQKAPLHSKSVTDAAPEIWVGMSPSQTPWNASPNTKKIIFRDGMSGAFTAMLWHQLSKRHRFLKGAWGIRKTDLLTEKFLEF